MRLAVLLAGLAVLAAGCGGAARMPRRSRPPTSDGQELPLRAEGDRVAAGDTVTWTNDDNFTHTVQVDGQEDHEVERGDSVAITFDEPGTYHYVCTLHRRDMDGTVTVT